MKHGQDKVALITGGSRGIGAAIAKRLASDGFTVAVNYASNPGAANAVVDEIMAAGGKALSVAADVSVPAAVAAMFALVADRTGGVDVLVNNAGIMDLAPIAKMDDATFDRMIAINLKGTFNTLREAAQRMRDGSRIINTSSSVTKLRLPAYGPYAATKAAVEVLTAILARELRGRNITVNAVAPGPTATALFFNGKSDELINTIKNMAPLQRLGEPPDIASVVAFLAGPDAAWVNGQTLFANGGAIWTGDAAMERAGKTCWSPAPPRQQRGYCPMPSAGPDDGGFMWDPINRKVQQDEQDSLDYRRVERLWPDDGLRARRCRSHGLCLDAGDARV